MDPRTGEIQRLKLLRAGLLEYFAKLLPVIIAMEACGSSQHWARRFAAMGHEVRLIATKGCPPLRDNRQDRCG